jgi:guanyl-specific ribonuclease Sa
LFRPANRALWEATEAAGAATVKRKTEAPHSGNRLGSLIQRGCGFNFPEQGVVAGPYGRVPCELKRDHPSNKRTMTNSFTNVKYKVMNET